MGYCWINPAKDGSASRVRDWDRPNSSFDRDLRRGFVGGGEVVGEVPTLLSVLLLTNRRGKVG